MKEKHLRTEEPSRVLIVEDECDFRGILVRRALRMGLLVDEAENGLDALETLSETSYDVLVTDLYMPGCSGLKVIQQARERDPDLQAIVMTAGATIESAIEALRAGAYDYLLKPLGSLKEYELSLRRALEHRHLLKENARLFSEVQRLAVTDPLTGLYNRRKLDEALDVEMERARRYERPLSLIMLDMDNLKGINDTHGHLEGDKAIKLVTLAMRSHVRRLDLATRVGGDEFVVLLPEADLEEATRVAERICAEVAAASQPGRTISTSAGVAQWDPCKANPSDFMAVVDQALYQSKRAGGGCVRAEGPAATDKDSKARAGETK